MTPSMLQTNATKWKTTEGRDIRDKKLKLQINKNRNEAMVINKTERNNTNLLICKGQVTSYEYLSTIVYNVDGTEIELANRVRKTTSKHVSIHKTIAKKK